MNTCVRWFWSFYQYVQEMFDMFSHFEILSPIFYTTWPYQHTAVEWIFSIADKIFCPDRCILKDGAFEKLISLKCNQHIGK